MNIQQDIKDFLDRSGWTQARLAREAQIHPILISRVLRGERKGLHSKTMEKLWPFLYGDLPVESSWEGSDYTDRRQAERRADERRTDERRQDERRQGDDRRKGERRS